jgi:spermidine synthase
LGLFLELTLIRWVTTEVRIFAYLQNTVLIVCFLGLGVGAYTCRQPFRLRNTLGILIVLAVLLTMPWTKGLLGGISEMLSYIGKFEIWIWNEPGARDRATTLVSVVVGLALTFVLMLLVFLSFVPIGRKLGQLLDDHPRPIWAYSVNVAGSLLGTWLTLALSAVQAPPAAWFALIALGSLAFLSGARRERALEIGMVVVLVALGFLVGREPRAVEVTWSPYQKLVLWTADAYRTIRPNVPGDYVLTVNNFGYQGVIDLRPERTRREPDKFPPQLEGYSQYDLPLRFHRDPKRVLLVGAGTGNDAAGALRGGASEITAVEIDPAIIEFGRLFHPEEPYSNPKVKVVTDDARSFFSRTEEEYDVIVFGLLDSHTTVGMTNARLDHYVYTRESIERARELLTDEGIVVLTFEAQKPWIGSRMARVLREVFDSAPVSFRVPFTGYGWGGAMFVAGDLGMVRQQLVADQRLGQVVRAFRQARPLQLDYSTRIATDNWPYIYLERPGIPALFYILAALVCVLFVVGCGLARAPSAFLLSGSRAFHFFFLGAAFLLLEVQNISKASIALGNTWWVNGVIISSVLSMILVANMVAARFPGISIGGVYAALLATCAGLWFVDLSWFGSLAFGAKALGVGAITTLPMLFSGIIFARSFAAAPHRNTAIGANLLGALVGGVLEPVTFLTGIRFLLVLVAVLYLASWITLPGVWPRFSRVLGRG